MFADGTEPFGLASLTSVGLWTTYGTLSRQLFNPWVGVGIGAEWLNTSASTQVTQPTQTTYDEFGNFVASTGGYTSGYNAEISIAASPVLSFEIGLGRRIVPNWAYGVYLGVNASQYTSGTVSCVGEECPNGLDTEHPSNSLHGSAWHSWFVFGLRLGGVAPIQDRPASHPGAAPAPVRVYGKADCEARGGLWDADARQCDEY